MADATTAVETQEKNWLQMSDEELLNAAPPEVVTPVAEAKTEEVKEAPAVEGKEEGGETTTEDADAVEQPKVGDEPADKTEVKDPPAKTETKTETTDKVDPAAEKKDPKEPVKEEAEAVNYEQEYKRLLAPFKANGREIQVKSVDDAISLMQMGANYNKKMAALKPSLKILKTLENNGLLSEEKIGWLIDLEKKNPDAINKLVKDAGINPLDLDGEKAGNYKPTVHAVDDREIELDTVLDELSESQSYNRLLTVVSKEWDGTSKQAIAAAPQLLRVLESHMASGIYDLISKEVENERVFGRLKGVADLEAYRQVGDAMQARGAFNHLVQKSQMETTQDKTVVVPPKPKVEDPALVEKRRAAAPTRTAAPSTAKPADYNPLAMSDEEFAKLADPRFR